MKEKQHTMQIVFAKLTAALKITAGVYTFIAAHKGQALASNQKASEQEALPET